MAAVQQITPQIHIRAVSRSAAPVPRSQALGSAFIEMKWRNNWSVGSTFEGELSRNSLLVVEGQTSTKRPVTSANDPERTFQRTSSPNEANRCTKISQRVRFN
jgi:hypothetical protein